MQHKPFGGWALPRPAGDAYGAPADLLVMTNGVGPRKERGKDGIQTEGEKEEKEGSLMKKRG